MIDQRVRPVTIIFEDGYASVETTDRYHGALPINDWIKCANYYKGKSPPNFPVPVIPQIYHWDYSLYIFLETYIFDETEEDNLDDWDE